MSRATGCKYVAAYWDRFTPAMRAVFTWQVKENPTEAMCPLQSKRRKSDGMIFFELHPVNKSKCDFCSYARKG